ncbi:MAG: divalent-cation tolerance protein CutA [Zoogloeaceae bacterium]|jgi:periplasmic divalent cation tolerance protein|nr:divalent-cation tolerance protein CutA [Zoogloeaceae bacterium]
MSQILLVLTCLPDPADAERLAATLVENGLAACVNILAPCRSVYRWRGKLETATEIPLFIKTHADRYEELQAAIRNQHPYDLPEIIAFPVDRGLPAYLDWVRQETEKSWLAC